MVGRGWWTRTSVRWASLAVANLGPLWVAGQLLEPGFAEGNGDAVFFWIVLGLPAWVIAGLLSRIQTNHWIAIVIAEAAALTWILAITIGDRLDVLVTVGALAARVLDASVRVLINVDRNRNLAPGSSTTVSAEALRPRAKGCR